MLQLAGDWVEANARLHPRAPALEDVVSREVTTWAGLEERVARLAGGLIDRLELRAGDRVVLLAENDVRSFELQFACMRIGALLVPLNWRLSEAELHVLVEDSGPAVIAHDEVHAGAATSLAEHIGVRTISWRCRGAANDLDQLVEASVARRARREQSIHDPVHILYTSGTTGRPKGALITRSNLVWHTANSVVVDALGGPGKRQLNSMPLFHVGGLNALANPLLMLGGCVAVARRFDPDEVVSILGDPTRQMSHFAAVPAMYGALVDHPDFERADLRGLQHAMVGAGFAPAQLVEAMASKGVALQPHYGSTEMGPTVTAMPAPDALRKVGTVGQAVLHTEVMIADPTGEPVPQGEVGEVWAAGPSISPGYWGRDRASDDAFVERWYRSGDAARIDEEGFMTIVDRYKDMYKSGGENVFPAEVERILADHPSIVDVAVVGIPDERWGEVGQAVVVLRPGTQVTVGDLADHCDGRLARFKVPRSVTTVDALPRNATGKVLKHLLRPTAEQRSGRHHLMSSEWGSPDS